MKLSYKACVGFKPGPKQYKKFDGNGLYLLVKPNGSKLWHLKYRIDRHEKLMALGPFPEVSLQDAREKVFSARKGLAAEERIDPMLERRHRSRLRINSAHNTFAVIATEWHSTKSSDWSAKHAENVMRRLQRDLFPTIGSRPVKQLTTVDKKTNPQAFIGLWEGTWPQLPEIFNTALVTNGC